MYAVCVLQFGQLPCECKTSWGNPSHSFMEIYATYATYATWWLMTHFVNYLFGLNNVLHRPVQLFISSVN